MDYSLLVGIHRCSDSAETTDESSSEDRLTADSCDASASVFVIKCSNGAYHFFIVFVLHCYYKSYVQIVLFIGILASRGWTKKYRINTNGIKYNAIY